MAISHKAILVLFPISLIHFSNSYFVFVPSNILAYYIYIVKYIYILSNAMVNIPGASVISLF